MAAMGGVVIAITQFGINIPHLSPIAEQFGIVPPAKSKSISSHSPPEHQTEELLYSESTRENEKILTDDTAEILSKESQTTVDKETGSSDNLNNDEADKEVSETAEETSNEADDSMSDNEKSDEINVLLANENIDGLSEDEEEGKEIFENSTDEVVDDSNDNVSETSGSEESAYQSIQSEEIEDSAKEEEIKEVPGTNDSDESADQTIQNEEENTLDATIIDETMGTILEEVEFVADKTVDSINHETLDDYISEAVINIDLQEENDEKSSDDTASDKTDHKESIPDESGTIKPDNNDIDESKSHNENVDNIVKTDMDQPLDDSYDQTIEDSSSYETETDEPDAGMFDEAIHKVTKNVGDESESGDETVGIIGEVDESMMNNLSDQSSQDNVHEEGINEASGSMLDEALSTVTDDVHEFVSEDKAVDAIVENEIDEPVEASSVQASEDNVKEVEAAESKINYETDHFSDEANQRTIISENEINVPHDGDDDALTETVQESPQDIPLYLTEEEKSNWSQIKTSFDILENNPLDAKSQFDNLNKMFGGKSYISMYGSALALERLSVQNAREERNAIQAFRALVNFGKKLPMELMKPSLEM